MSTSPSPSARNAIGRGFSDLPRAPFRTLVLISLLIAVTTTTFSDRPTGTETTLSIVLLVASIYLQIAIILAAGRDDPDPSADTWLLGAVRRRCFWRFVGTSLVVVLGLLAGALLLVIGMFVVGALLGFAQPASVLERKLPMDAVSQSVKLATPARGPVGLVFGLLILIPTVVTQTVAVLGWDRDLGLLWPALLIGAELVTIAGTIALTRLFVTMGGEATPPADRLAPVKPQRPS